MSARVEFRLAMPGRSSWDGKWSGDRRNYTIVRNLGERDIARLGLGGGEASWSYAFGDGWCACVTARVMQRGERAARSDGFCGYDWMVRSIMLAGKILTDDVVRPAPSAGGRQS